MNYTNMDLNLIKIFIEVYECKSVLAASKKLYVSQPAVSNSIKKLEVFLGGELFVRKSKGVIPTTEGTQFYDSCKEFLHNLNNSINTFSKYTSLEKGYINIGSSSTIMRRILLPFISEFSEKHPNIIIRVTDAISEELTKLLKIGEIDIAILSSPVQNDDFFSKTLLTKTMDCFIAPLTFEKNFLKKEELKDYPLIAQKKAFKQPWLFWTFNNEKQLRFNSKIRNWLLWSYDGFCWRRHGNCLHNKRFCSKGHWKRKS